MKSLPARLITFFVGIPAIVCVVLFLPHQHFLALNIIITVFTIVGATETARLFASRGGAHDTVLPVICAALFPIFAYLELAGLIATSVNYILLPAVVWLLLFSQLFRQDDTSIHAVLDRTGANLVTAMYPGVLSAFLVRITGFESAGFAFLVFIVAVFSNDSMAYVFGMMFGKNNRGVFAISPKKSVAGLAAGLAFSIGSVLIFYAFFSDYFSNRFVLAFAVGLGVGLATIAGDLVESALKRSAGVKDSGNVIPGRGGILDSMDSVVFAAPVFYLLIRYFS